MGEKPGPPGPLQIAGARPRPSRYQAYRYGHATHISNFECASDSPLLSAKLKEAHALLEAERLEAFAPTGKKADSATFTNPLDEQDARDDSDGDGDGEDGGGGDDNRT